MSSTENKEIFCPLVNADCVGERCVLYDDSFEEFETDELFEKKEKCSLFRPFVDTVNFRDWIVQILNKIRKEL